MILKKHPGVGVKKRFREVVFGLFLMILGALGGSLGVTENVYAEPTESGATATSCDTALGSLGWLVCPATGKVSEAVDFLYDKIEDVLVINPVEMEDGSPIYEIWKYFQGITNILFIIFLLVTIYSQITGVGISNYGIKKALPKLIIAAVLVNLSFYICSLAVDVSNILGNGIRGLFETISESTSGNMTVGAGGVSLSEMYSGLAAGTGVAIGGALIAFETGAIWMLIPLALGALVSVVVGLITIAMRQAVVTLLIMIAPLAMVAYILPNTEQWFKKWRQLLFQMLIFYPAFSLLFGASSVAGWAIIVSSQNGFGILIGVAVQIFPLFFSWSLMKMSGTVLGMINTKLNQIASAPLGGVKGWAESHRELTRQRNLASPNAYTPSLRLQQFLSDRKVMRDEETKDYAELVKNRGLAYTAMRNYRRDGETPSKEGEESYEMQARNMEYQQKTLRHKNNMNKGLGQLEALKRNGTAKQKARLNALDGANVQASDRLKMEQARGEMIDYRNSVGFHNRMEEAMNSHMDDTHGFTTDADGRRIAAQNYKRHFEPGTLEATQASMRYADLSQIMEGDVVSSHYAAASAAQAYDGQAKVMATKMQKYFELAPPTQDVVYRLDELSKIASIDATQKAATNIDAIISGLRVLNMRGDTDLVKAQIDNLLDKNLGGGIELGTHASQALASFLMFEVKDSDPFLRRFGKYINLETARVYNQNDRKITDLTYDEYIKGYHDGEPDYISAENPTGRMYAKKDMMHLLEGTSLDNVERTAFSNLDESLKKAYGFDGSSNWDVEGWLKKREEIQTAFEPAFLSASLKWLSGSEQINSGVKFWTGYEQKQMKDANGNLMTDENGDPVYGLSPVWKSKEFAGHEDAVEKYYRRKTGDYFRDQTTGQILGMRTDYRDATMEHLVAMYLEGLKDEDEMSEAERAEYAERQEEYNKKKAEIQTRYGDKDIEEADKLRKKDLKALKMDIAGRQVRKILGETGKLEQLYRTRRSGSANNAKDWLRRWVNLDDEETMAQEVKYYADLRKKQKEDDATSNTDDDENVPIRVYGAGDRKNFREQLEKTYHDNQDASPEEFYEIERDLLKQWFGDMTSKLEWEFRKFYEDETKAGHYLDAYKLKTKLEDLLQDPDNYPDA